MKKTAMEVIRSLMTGDIYCSSEEVSCIVIGEEHYNTSHIEQQISLIESIRPEIILHQIEGGRIFDPKQEKYIFQPGRQIDKFEFENGERCDPRLIEQSIAFGHKIIGIDYTTVELDLVYRKMVRENPDQFGWKWLDPDDETRGGFIINLKDPDYEFDSQDDITTELITIKMAELIGKYTKTSTGLTVAIVGAYYAREFVRKGMLNEFGFDYIVIDQCNK